MTQSHTPTPWKLSSRALITASVQFDMPIAICYDAQSHIQGPDAKQADANAAFIVRACNAHDDLIKALEKAHARLKKAKDWYGTAQFDEPLDLEIINALAKAKAGAE